ncbi:MAG: hypothetical protein HY868_09855 [Chloroflexi bacterium]|nr:hypothetical protein [Chloroflexota bacterium]
MVWRRWSVIVVLILANYIVFSLLATWVFPVPPVTPVSHAPQPTFTPGGKQLKQVEPLAYEFLTPSPIATLTRRPGATGTPATPSSATITATATLSATVTLTDNATSTVTATVPITPTGTSTLR